MWKGLPFQGKVGERVYLFRERYVKGFTFSGKGLWKGLSFQGKVCERGYLFRERYVKGLPFQGKVCVRVTFSGKGMCKGLPFQGKVCERGTFSGKGMWKGLPFQGKVCERVPIFEMKYFKGSQIWRVPIFKILVWKGVSGPELGRSIPVWNRLEYSTGLRCNKWHIFLSNEYVNMSMHSISQIYWNWPIKIVNTLVISFSLVGMLLLSGISTTKKERNIFKVSSDQFREK